MKLEKRFQSRGMLLAGPFSTCFLDNIVQPGSDSEINRQDPLPPFPNDRWILFFCKNYKMMTRPGIIQRSFFHYSINRVH